MSKQALRIIFTRDFVLTSFGLFTLGFVFHILTPTLPIYLSTLGSKEVEIGILIGIFGFSSLVLRPLVGRALLETPEKRMMIGGALLYTMTSGAYLLAGPFWPFLAVRILQGAGFAVFHTASFTLIANISSDAYRMQSLSYFILSFNLASAIAPAAGVFLINHFGFTVLFLVCLGLSLCSLLISLQVKKGRVVPRRDAPIEDGLLLSRKAVPPSILCSFALFSWGAISAFFPLYAINHGVTNPGIFFTVAASMLILGRALGGRILNFTRRESIILPCLMTYILSMAILAFSKTMPMFILVAVIWGIGHAFLIPTLLVYALEAGASPGPAMGTFHAISDLGFSLGPVIMGVVLRFAGYPAMFLCLSFTGILNFSYFYLFVRRKR